MKKGYWVVAYTSILNASAVRAYGESSLTRQNEWECSWVANRPAHEGVAISQIWSAFGSRD
jgi:hypothetical protein